MASDLDVKTALLTDEEIARLRRLVWEADATDEQHRGALANFDRLLATIAHERELREKAEKERDEFRRDSGGMRLLVVDDVLGSWDCALNADAVQCGHMYCREHELVWRVNSLRTALASSEEARKKAEGELTVNRLWAPVPHGHSTGGFDGLDEAYQRECHNPACVDWERLEDRR